MLTRIFNQFLIIVCCISCLTACSVIQKYTGTSKPAPKNNGPVVYDPFNPDGTPKAQQIQSPVTNANDVTGEAAAAAATATPTTTEPTATQPVAQPTSNVIPVGKMVEVKKDAPQASKKPLPPTNAATPTDNSIATKPDIN